MAVVIDGKVYFKGMFVGADRMIEDGVIDIEYDKPRVYVVN